MDSHGTLQTWVWNLLNSQQLTLTTMVRSVCSHPKVTDEVVDTAAYTASKRQRLDLDKDSSDSKISALPIRHLHLSDFRSHDARQKNKKEHLSVPSM